MLQFTDQQRAAIDAEAQMLAIVAGAGSGKTSVLVERIATHVPVGRNLVFTLTNATARELRRRLSERGCVGDVTTVHGYCYKLVCENADALGYAGPPTIIDDEEIDSLVKSVRQDVGADCPLEGIRKMIARQPGKFAAHPKFDSIIKCANEVRNRLKYNNQTTYELLVEDAIATLKTVAQDDCYIYIDEAQDIDGRLWRIVELLPWKHLCAVGDPRQAIFGFRGGDANAFMKFAKNADLRVDLLENFRSLPSIVDAANRVFPEYAPMVYRHLLRENETTNASAIIARTNRELDKYERENKDTFRLRGAPPMTPFQRRVRARLRLLINPFDNEAKKAIAGPGENDDAELWQVESIQKSGVPIAEVLAESARGLDTDEREPLPGATVLSTVHLAKGREWDVVTILADGFRDTEEDKKCFYVALTRAKHHVKISSLNFDKLPSYIKNAVK